MDELLEVVRTGAFALWALVVWIATQELKKLRWSIDERNRRKDRGNSE